MLSEMFLKALRNTGKPLHKTAWAAGITPSAMYRLTSGIDHPKPGDKRIKKLCAYLGMSEDEAYVSPPIGDKAA